jgi:TolB-like protein
VIDPAIREHGGRVVQTGGDSLLVAFDSIEGAVRCAIKVQQQVPVYDGDRPPERRIRFRIGINIGDVIPHGTDLYGDGVNIAARLETQSPVGGICVSRAVRDHVHGRLDLAFEAIGPLTLKNIARPVEAFVLRLDPGTAEQSSKAGNTGRLGTHVGFRPTLAAGVLLLFVCISVLIGWWFVHAPTRVATSPEASPFSIASQPVRPAMTQDTTILAMGLANAPRLSLVVLPFNMFGAEGLDEDTVNGITDALTRELLRWAGSHLVIARNSAFTYKGKPIDVERVGEELGVRYAVEGSVRRTEGTLCVNVQLVSTETGVQLWAERFDVKRDGPGYNVDDIVRQIGLALNVRLIDIESARSTRERPTDPDVTDILLQARALYNLPPNPQTQTKVMALFERAVELDPSSATALAGLAEALLDSLSYFCRRPNAPGELPLMKKGSVAQNSAPTNA